MTTPRVNYDALASTYNRRFEDGSPQGVGEALVARARELGAQTILEVGCGTGHWLGQLQSAANQRYGLDLSAGMLAQAQRRPDRLALVCGTARRLPFANKTFDFVYCVNAIHHFADPAGYVAEAFRILRAGGACAVVGSNPHGGRDNWYVYEHFDGVYETDLARFPTWDTAQAWMQAAGFEDIEREVAEHITERWRGRDVLSAPYLRKNSCSQLALLSNDAYAAGINRIEAAIEQAERAGEEIVFHADIVLTMMTGYKAKEI